MKKLRIYTVLLLSILVYQGCDDGLAELNIDPNSAVTVDASTLLTTAEYTFNNALQGTGLNAGWGLLMTQQWAENEYTEDSRYSQDITSFNGTWNTMYVSVLKELSAAKEIVIAEDISDAIKNNRIAIIDVMSAQVYAFLTDSFGDVPYSEALSDVSSPKYDSQQEIYMGILATLDNAAQSFNNSAPSFTSGEVIYDGNVDSWIKFTNSLMLRYAMRIADIDANTAGTYVAKAATNLISSNSENALFVFAESAARSNPLYQNNTPLIGNRDDYSVSEYLVETLRGMGDPRLEKYSKETSTGEIIGMPYGILDNAASNLQATTSRPNDAVRSPTTPHVIISYAEVEFLLAEAYQRGFLSGSAENAYNNGVTASMNYWGISDAAAISAYISNNAYNASNWKASIGTQKWIALYMNGLEGWNEHRRLDYPQLAIPAEAVINTIPKRMPYPLSETQVNSAQLNAITSDPADMTTKLWWDVN